MRVGVFWKWGVWMRAARRAAFCLALPTLVAPTFAAPATASPTGPTGPTGPVAPEAAAATGSLTREVFPVPETVRQVFAGSGLEAFNPFFVWGPRSSSRELPDFPTAPVTEAEAALLPPGRVYDVVPVWENLGLRPQTGTRVLYHPGSGLLFARMAPEDEARVRDFCSWPLKVQAASFYSGGAPDSSYQPQVAVSTWLVPATGPGDWSFLPRTPEELMALPEAARTLAGRQRMTVRSSQRTIVRAQRQRPADRDHPVGGLQFEAEITRADDGVYYDILARVALTRRLKSSGRVTELTCVSSRLTHQGDQWLVEAGTLPDDPPLRVFHILSLPDKPEVPQTGEPISKMVARWTGDSPERLRGTAAPVSGGSPDAVPGFLVADDWRMSSFVQTALFSEHSKAGKSPLADNPAATAPANPQSPDAAATAAATASVTDNWSGPWDKGKQVNIPGWFGDEEVTDVSTVVAEAFRLAPGSIQAWRWENLVFIKGQPDAVASIRRTLDLFSNPISAARPLLEAILSRRRPAGASSSSPAPGRIGGGQELAPSSSLASADAVISRVLLPMKENWDFELTLKDQIEARWLSEPNETTLGKLTLFLTPRADSSEPETDEVAAASETSAAITPTGGTSAAAPPLDFQATVTLSLSPPLTKAPLQVALVIPAGENQSPAAEVARLPDGGTLMLSLRTHHFPPAPPVPASQETLLEYWWMKTVSKAP